MQLTDLVKIPRNAEPKDVEEFKEIAEFLKNAIGNEKFFKSAINNYEAQLRNLKSELYQATKKRKALEKQFFTFWRNKRAKAKYNEVAKVRRFWKLSEDGVAP